MAMITRLNKSSSFAVSLRNYRKLSHLVSWRLLSQSYCRAISSITIMNNTRKTSHKYQNCERSSSSIAQNNEATLQEVQIVEEQWKKQFLNTQKFGEAVFVLGPMGAGKTTVIENHFRSHPVYSSYAYVDTDEIMGMIPHFTSDKVEKYYPIARGMAIRLTDWILEKKISFIAEGTCVKYLELIDYMQRLKTGGYVIRVKRLPQVSLDLIMKRSKNRLNRQVPDHVVRAIYYGSKKGLDSLYEYNKSSPLFEDVDEMNERNVVVKSFETRNGLHFENY